MGHSACARAWRAIVIIACGMGWFGPVACARAGTLDAIHAILPASPAVAPFGLAVAPVSSGDLLRKWRAVMRRLEDERVQLALCDGDRERCASDAALRFLAIVDAGRSHEGRARLGQVNRAINLAIHPMSDLAQYGEEDVWSSPLVTFDRGAGDCEDYAIAKWIALQLAGVAAEDLQIVVLRDAMNGEDHAVTAARLDGHWLMLDNRRMAMVEDSAVRNYRPLFSIGEAGVMRYSEPPMLAAAPQQDASVATP
ncbi:MAG: transglutaminase-like cysteine peptidase [Bradyrhizobium sp.]|uniref:transglutaminase-like cysteine peptidase n=1 Tax=Bradyrhizobium sp. TaxID=376 RepID=UPI001DC706CA|nr:transglutaminase-like cysteine peptidase [Bradyrhizobium sp.]MBV9559681.1 transglutaminase-like cysteine peptidase [Bradyrhizobium sp.]